MIEVTEATFGETVIKAKVPVLLKMYSDGCPPCRRIQPLLDRMEANLHGQVLFAKMNVESNQWLASYLGIGGVPTLIVFIDGCEEGRLVGIQSEEKILAALGQEQFPEGDLFKTKNTKTIL